ncbi:arginine--tRNA ligase [Candidatus Nomurabacteria bacterium]|nr:arginine--tRNA ligase [Candidatus Nomurabacteria bacterium]
MELDPKQMLHDVLVGAVVKNDWPEEVDFVVDYPTDKNAQADLFSNVAMVLSKRVGSAPRAVAEQLLAALPALPQVTAVEVAGSGFINFTLDRSYFTSVLAGALEAGENWGKNASWQGKKVLVEYTDPNPFKEFHVGHLFTNAVGESIARLFMMNGADTKRVNYQGDVGLHVAHAIWGLRKLGVTNVAELTPKILGKAYATGATAYKEDQVAADEIREINKLVYSRADAAVNEIYDAGRKVSLGYFETIYALVGTQFDEYFFESEAGPKGKELVLAHPEVFPESDGARIFDGEQYGLHTRVFLNKEGLPTYEAKELALAKLKKERLGEYDHSVISTANEVSQYFKVLLKAMSLLYPELAAKTEHIGHGTVRLSTGKMSSRTGDVIPAIDFVAEVAEKAAEKMAAPSHQLANEVAIAAIKYATLKGNILQDSVFDKEKALSFEGDSGPYLQYTHARICSVLEKAAEAGVQVDASLPPPEAYAVEKLLERFPSVVEAALAERAPHQVTGYLTELAGAFNSFYAAEKIADAADQYAPYKAAVAKAVALTLQQGLWTLGISAPERM